jgi:hypothetical protein
LLLDAAFAEECGEAGSDGGIVLLITLVEQIYIVSDRPGNAASFGSVTCIEPPPKKPCGE